MRHRLRCLLLVPAVGLALAGSNSVCAQAVDAHPEDVTEAVAAEATEDDAAQAEAIESQPTLIRVESPAEDVATVTDDDELISITLDDVPIVDVIRMFTRISGANIIASAADMEGTVTVNLQDVAWRPALNSILDMHGLSLVEKELGSGVYSIVPRPANAPIPMQTKSFQLKFATVSDVGPVVRSMLVEGASLNEFGSRNMLIIRSTPENLADINAIIKDVDKLSKQVCIETKIMELTDAASRQLGIRWDSLAEFGVRLQGGPFTWSRDVQSSFARQDSLTQWDRRNNVDNLNQLFDMGSVQFEDTETAFVDHDGDPLTPPIAEIDVVPSRTLTDTIDRGRDVDQSIVRQFSRTIQESQAAVLELDQFQVILSALKTTDGVSLISNPKLIVANGSTNAFFSVGAREPIIRTEITRGTQDSPGDVITAELDTSIDTEYITEGYLATGIDLRVIPVVKTEDLIEAEIRPSLRRKTGSKVVGQNSWPIISVKEIRTRFTLRSGQTAAIGGLTDTSDQKETSKVPLLGDIPLIGRYLFSHERDVQQQVETIIFVTLSLAQADQLDPNVGIPDQAELVHKELIRRRGQLQDLEADLEQLQEAADAAQQEKSHKARTRLLRRRK